MRKKRGIFFLNPTNTFRWSICKNSQSAKMIHSLTWPPKHKYFFFKVNHFCFLEVHFWWWKQINLGLTQTATLLRIGQKFVTPPYCSKWVFWQNRLALFSESSFLKAATRYCNSSKSHSMELVIFWPNLEKKKKVRQNNLLSFFECLFLMAKKTRHSTSPNCQLAQMGLFWLDYEIESDFVVKMNYFYLLSVCFWGKNKYTQ